MFDKTLYISRTDKRQDFAYRQQNGWSIVHTPSYLQKPAFGSVPLQPAETRAIHFRVPKTLTFKMRLGAQPFLWKWVLLPWEWKMISISKAEYLPSFWNRGPGELGNGLLTYNNISSWHYCTFYITTWEISLIWLAYSSGISAKFEIPACENYKSFAGSGINKE